MADNVKEELIFNRKCLKRTKDKENIKKVKFRKIRANNPELKVHTVKENYQKLVKLHNFTTLLINTVE